MVTTAHPGTAMQTVRRAIEDTGAYWRDRGQHALMASCPRHDDTTPSLSITWTPRPGRPGLVLMHCFACQASIGELAAALGLRVSDLYDDAAAAVHTPRPRPAPQPNAVRGRAHGRARAEHRWQRVRAYTYTTAAGQPVQQVLREECRCGRAPHKRFLQRYRHARGWEWRKPANFTPVLYRARELAAAAPSTWVWLVEGEKDADTAARLGRVATTNAQGAAHFPRELLADLAGRNVAIVVDRDAAGYQRGLHLHTALSAHTAQLQLLLPAPTHPKADLTDHVEARLWDSRDRFGGLLPASAAQLEQLHCAHHSGRAQKVPTCSPPR